MSIVLDTNVVLYHLGGRLQEDLPLVPIIISGITEIELLSYPGLSSAETLSIGNFLARTNLIDLTTEIKREAIAIRRSSKLKLPDAVIAATALSLQATLWTADALLAKTLGDRAHVPKY